MSAAPDSVFSSYGKVLELGTQEAIILGEKRLQLTAVADVSEAAVSIQQQNKKAFASIEIMPNFTGRGISYLTGLALTDSPASLGTETMRFSAFTGEQSSERYAFPGAVEIGLADESDPTQADDNAPDEASLGEKLFTKVKELIGLGNQAAQGNDARFSDHAAAVTVIAQSQRDLLAAFGKIEENAAALGARLEKIGNDLDASIKAFAALKTHLATQPAGSGRPPATGGEQVKTDC